MIVLTDVQREKLDACGALDVTVAETECLYVLIRKDVYERLESLLEDEPREAYPAVDRAFAPGWDEPGMSDYDRYEELRS